MDSNKKNFIIQNFYNYIKTSLDYKDECVKNDEIKYEKANRYEKEKENNIICYNSNNEIIFKIKYQIIGIFDRRKNIFNWGWSISNIDNKYLFFSNKLLTYGLKLSTENIIMKLLLTKSEIAFSNLLFEDFISKNLSHKKFLYLSNAYDISLICPE